MSAENIDAFFGAPGGSDETVTLNGVDVFAYFDLDYTDVMSMSGTGPAITLPSARCVGVVQGWPVVARGVSYKVIEVKPDGTGVTVLKLHNN